MISFLLSPLLQSPVISNTCVKSELHCYIYNLLCFITDREIVPPKSSAFSSHTYSQNSTGSNIIAFGRVRQTLRANTLRPTKKTDPRTVFFFWNPKCPCIPLLIGGDPQKSNDSPYSSSIPLTVSLFIRCLLSPR